jgi:hypothetical protein
LVIRLVLVLWLVLAFPLLALLRLLLERTGSSCEPLLLSIGLLSTRLLFAGLLVLLPGLFLLLGLLLLVGLLLLRLLFQDSPLLLELLAPPVLLALLALLQVFPGKCLWLVLDLLLKVVATALVLPALC